MFIAGTIDSLLYAEPYEVFDTVLHYTDRFSDDDTSPATDNVMFAVWDFMELEIYRTVKTNNQIRN